MQGNIISAVHMYTDIKFDDFTSSSFFIPASGFTHSSDQLLTVFQLNFIRRIVSQKNITS